MIQITEEGWTFTLDNRKVLTIHGQGMTKTYRHDGMTPDQLQGFAKGWVGHALMVSVNADIDQDKYPVYLPA
jgi:hypothetical protein